MILTSKTNPFTIALLNLLIFLTGSIVSTQGQNVRDYIIHEVQAKETVYSIARKNGLKEQDIYRLNPGSEKGIKTGEKLKIPIKNANIPSTVSNITPSHAGVYTVVNGDTFFSIAKRFGIPTTVLKQYNPDIDTEKIQPGMEIRIALPDGTPLTDKGSKIYVVSENNLNHVKVALILPINKDGSPERYVRFYEGFLMGVYRLKKAGISIDLDLHTATNTRSVKNIIEEGSLIGKDIVIGGQSEEEINILSRYTNERGMAYVSPFVSGIGKAEHVSSSTFVLNTPQEDLYPYLSVAYLSKAKGKKTYFVRTHKQNHISVVKCIKSSLDKAHLPYEDIPIDKISKTTLKGDNLIIIPDDGSIKTIEQILQKLEKEQISARNVSLFGYPEWQSYGIDILKRIGVFNGTIYTSFFFDENQRESENFIKNYQAWYTKPMDNIFPKYSVLGYDTSRYFLRALASYGIGFINVLPQIPSDGLQNDFLFRNINGKKSLHSINIFFVTYTPEGRPKKSRVVY